MPNSCLRQPRFVSAAQIIPTASQPFPANTKPIRLPVEPDGLFFALRRALLHFLLLDLVIHHMAAGQLGEDVLGLNAHFDHQNHHMIGQIGDFKDGLLPIAALSGDDDLGAFLADLLENLIDALLEQIGGIAALLGAGFPPLQQLIQRLDGKIPVFLALIESPSGRAFRSSLI